MSTSFRFLHLTDLHAGINGEKWLFPEIGHLIQTKLKEEEQADLLFFTGDLSQQGTAAELAEFQKHMEKIREASGKPLLLAVPGNHDLIRPKKTSPLLAVAKGWSTADFRDHREEFYGGEGDFFDAIQKAFAPWSDWWAKQPAARHESYVSGLLPGDYRVSLDIGGLKIGVVGLNTAFLHLYDAPQGSLSVDPRQLQKLWSEGAPHWTAQHHLCLLLTHHPPDWLDAPGREALRTEINPAHPQTRFGLHLFGHDHAGQLSRHAIGGADDRTELLGRSLLGLEKLANGLDRSHGYARGRVEIAPDGRRQLHFSPSTLKKVPSVGWSVVSDTDRYILVNGTEIRPLSLGKSPLSPVPPATPATAPEQATAKRPPSPQPSPLEKFRAAVKDRAEKLPPSFGKRLGGRHLSKVYVSLKMQAGFCEEEERFAAQPRRGKRSLSHDLDQDFPIEDLLRDEHRLWVVLGEPGTGKTTQLQHLACHLLEKTDLLPVFLKVTELERLGWPGALSVLGGDMEEEVGTLLSNNRAVLLIDGLDEALDKELARKKLRELVRDHASAGKKAPSCRIFVSSRPAGYEPLSTKADPEPQQFRELGIRPLRPEAQVELLVKWGIDAEKAQKELERARQNSRIRRLVENPLLLSLIAMLLGEKESIPATRAELYRKATDLMLRHQTGAIGVPKLLPSPDEALKVLCYLALELHGRSGVAYQRGDVVEVLNEAPQRYRGWIRDFWGDTDGYLRQISLTNLLIPDEDHQLYSFPHRTFREYLTAVALQQEIRGHGLPDVDPDLLKVIVEGNKIPEPPVPEAFGKRMATARQDTGTWAEVLALCCALEPAGADVLVRRTAVHGGLELVRRVVADAEGLQADTLLAVLGMEKGGKSWQMRSEVIAALPNLTGDLRAAVDLCWRFVKTTRNGADLWFARAFFHAVAGGQMQEQLQVEDEAEVLGKARDYATRIFEHIPKADLDRAIRMIRWVDVPGKTGRLEFLMGSPEKEAGRYDDEGPQHIVRFGCGFSTMDAPVTNAVYECFDPEHKAERKDFGGKFAVSAQDDVPAYNLTWYEAQMFSEWIATAAPGSRLPVEAEWEYFCRAGSPTAYHSGTTEADLRRAGWYGGNSGGHPHPVRQKEPNAWGLYDCHGNVWEWCLDERKSYRDGALDLDPRDLRSCPTLTRDNVCNIIVPPVTGRVFRGGSWSGNARGARSARRLSGLPDGRGGSLGFRLVRPPPQD